MAFTPSDLSAKATKLNHVETVVRRAPVDFEALRAVNPALAAFYERELMGDDPASSVDIRVVVGNTSTPVPGSDPQLFDWTVFVRPEDPGKDYSAIVRHAVFDLHPTFTPSSVVKEERPFEVTRRGWGVFDVHITLGDLRGRNLPTIKHRLSFSGQDNTHVEAFSVDVHDGLADTVPVHTPELPRMTEVDEIGMHGRMGAGQGWAAPFLVTHCDEDARPGYNTMKAHEYSEDPMTLRAKVKMLADMITKANHCIAYTGAGISTASGIDDYASRAKNSVATGTAAVRPQKRGLEAEPTFAHYTLAALHRAGHLRHWVQQNHDGLPQKAGFPQSALNEIHGAWFDPANPVVPMDGSLRGDLNQWMSDEEHAADLVLTVGTSLCGMNADRVVSTPSRKFIKKGTGLGSVIINYQQTQMDKLASLRFYARIDEVMLLLAWEMGLEVSTEPYTPSVPADAQIEEHVFRVPYAQNGKPSKKGKCTVLDLRVGAKVQLTGGPGKGFVGEVVQLPGGRSPHAYTMKFPCNRENDPDFGKKLNLYAFGTWWVESAVSGTAPHLPVINA